MTFSPDSSTPIEAAIAHLRQLTRLDRQAYWRGCLQDLPAVQATDPAHWQDWAIAPLNARHHIAWAKGENVLWLGQQFQVPTDLQGYSLEGLTLRLALTWWAIDAQIYVNGTLIQAGDLFDSSTRILLSEAVQPGEAIAVALRLVSPGHDDGALVRSMCLYERPGHSLEPCPEPGWVADELAVLQHYVQTFAPEQQGVLEGAIAQMDWSALPRREAFDQSLMALRQALLPLSSLLKQRQIHLLGHAHLDLAWLWAVSETWEVAESTFKSVLHLQNEFPELIFCHSTPALYAWVEQNRPELFKAIQQQVAAGRWEVVAGLWVEPELNLVSGESLARQVLYGQLYVQEKFGKVSAIAWLPDSFGFCWQLPQILQLGEVEFFVTQKLRWNDTNVFPHEAFWWRSPDGSAIFSLHSAPIGEGIDPLKMTEYACQWEQKTSHPESLWLIGVGDHGGGPSRDMLETARRWQQSPFFPKLCFSPAETFLHTLRTTAPSPLPTWDDELYLEFHRGCYTTHADQKQLNRQCERLLYQAELFASLATLVAEAEYPKAAIEDAWKKVLFNQFHDILPGSAISEVYEDADCDWHQAVQAADEILLRALQAIAQQIHLSPPPHPDSQPLVVFNALNWERSEVVAVPLPMSAEHSTWEVYDAAGRHVLSQLEFQGATPQLLFQATGVPGVGYRVFWLSRSHATQPPTSAPANWILENERLQVEVNPLTGNLSSVFDPHQQREILSAPGNVIQAFRDQGQYWDAWNIDPNYADHPLPAPSLESIRWVSWGPLRQRLRVVRRLGKSMLQQDYVLDVATAVLKIETVVDWQERHTLVKVAFPLNLNADHLVCEIPFGAIQHPTRPTKPEERAKWEVPALQWATLQASASGVSLLNNCKHGYDATPNQLRLTLLRGSEWPNPNADYGRHEFTYAIYPHGDRWQSSHTVRRGYELNQPLRLLPIAATNPNEQARSPKLPEAGQLLKLENENLILSAFKQSEQNPQQWIVRCYESLGEGTELAMESLGGLAIAHLSPTHPVNLLEKPLTANLEVFTEEFLEIFPWKIINLQLQSADSLNLHGLQTDLPTP